MPKCNYEYKPKVPNVLEDIPPEILLDCKVPTENGKFCIFHDKDYYVKSAKQAITPKYEVAKRFEDKVKESIDQNKPLICFGYYLPGINFAELLGKSIAQPVYFSQATFSKESNFRGATFTERADFVRAKFTEGAWFGRATFSKDADFRGVKFLDEVYFLHDKFKEKILFRYTLFEQQNKVTFGDNDLSKVSFAGSDVTRIRFGDGITWGGKDKITIIEEEWLRERAEGQTKTEVENVKLELVLSVYRNLRENYEFRLRYDDAGKFFIKEMELKRKYREIRTENDTQTKKNGWFRRHFSLTGLYYHLSTYGESISKPVAIGALTVFLSTLFWVTQSNPSLEPHFDPNLAETVGNSTFVGVREFGNPTQWLKGLERSLAGFIPLLSLGGETEVGIIDFIIKIFGGGLTFVLLAIALRRKFERKYTR